MNYADINRNMTLPMRQRSLFNIISAARLAASESRDLIAVIHAPIYVDEFADSEHVFCPKIAIDILYPKRNGVDWNIDAIVDPNGDLFFTRQEDCDVVLTHLQSQVEEAKNETR